MAATARNTRTPNFLLTPLQQQALFAALQSNQPAPATVNTESLTKKMPTLDQSPVQQTPGSGTLNSFNESPFGDYDYDFDNDGSFGDFDYTNTSGQMIGSLPGGSSDGDAGAHDKRSHSEDEDDEDGGGKRREGDDKGSKKPGRKPLTSEPTSKRKAQNRAAQRAFRERKEKHLKDLETKVQDLEKASESANHENAILRAQVGKMATELKEYRKRLSGGGAVRSQTLNDTTAYLQNKGFGNTVTNPNEVNFQFDFPKFGRLPGPAVPNNSRSSTTGASPDKSSRNGTVSPLNQTLNHTPSFSSSNGVSPFTQTSANDLSDFAGLFTPSTLDAAAKDSFDYLGSRSSVDSVNGLQSTGHNTSESSPASSNSNNGLSSSCDTSPEPYTQSPPANKGLESTLTTIGEESQSVQVNNVPTTSFDVNGIDWFAQQNGNQFDPVLFGDYREPQDNVLSGGLYDDSFFSDAFAINDFQSPFILDASPAPVPAKKDLVAEIDSKLNAEDEVVHGEGTLLNCTSMWEKLQSCPKVASGEINMDDLCSQLQQKAKCSGDGPVIQEADFRAVIDSVFPVDPVTGKSPCGL